MNCLNLIGYDVKTYNKQIKQTRYFTYTTKRTTVLNN